MSQAWVDACAAPGGVVVLRSIDDSSVRVPISFNFPYWGRVVPAGAQINVVSNGWIGMNALTLATLRGTIPGMPTDAIAAYLTDLVTRQGVCIATTGSAPTRQFVVEWNDVMFYSTRSGDLTFEVILHEGSGVIDFLYQTMSARAPAGYSPAVGINSASTATGTAVCSGLSSLCPEVTSGTRIRFVPTP